MTNINTFGDGNICEDGVYICVYEAQCSSIITHRGTVMSGDLLTEQSGCIPLCRLWWSKTDAWAEADRLHQLSIQRDHEIANMIHYRRSNYWYAS